MFAKQSTALTLIAGPILDSAGAEYTGAVIGDLSISKNGGTLTALAAAATLTHIANGQYTLVLTTGNTDTLGAFQVTCNKSTYQMPMIERHVIPATVYDAIVTNATNSTGGLLAATAAVSAASGYIGASGATINGTNVNTLAGHDPGETIMGATDLGAGAGLTAIPWNASWDAEVQSEVADALGVYDPPTRTEATADKDEVLAAVAAIDLGGIVVSASSSVLDTIDDGGNITLRRGDRVSFSLTLGNVTGRTGEKLFFTIKRQNTNDTDDSNAIVQITETTGAVLVNGSSTGVTAADASITVSNETTGVTVFLIQDSITTLFPVGSGWHYDVQMIRADGKAVTLTYGSVSIVADTTRRKTI